MTFTNDSPVFILFSGVVFGRPSWTRADRGRQLYAGHGPAAPSTGTEHELCEGVPESCFYDLEGFIFKGLFFRNKTYFPCDLLQLFASLHALYNYINKSRLTRG